MNDDLIGYEPQENEFSKLVMKIVGLFLLIVALIMIIIFTLSAGCVTESKKLYKGLTETPIPTLSPTPEPTEIIPEPTLEPVPTESETAFMLRTKGYHMREWLWWYRSDVEGIRPGPTDTGDLTGYVTVYGYKFMPSYHWYSISWARKFLVKPEDTDNQFLFFYVNEYVGETSVRQYGFDCLNFYANFDGRIYRPEPVEYPERRITEFDEIQNYGRTESIKPFAYKIIQDLDTGSYRADKMEFIYSGRSNAWDGYCMVEIPHDATAETTKIYGSFANLGGIAWWKLE